MRIGAHLGIALLAALPAVAAGQAPETPRPLTYELARVGADAGLTEARATGWNVTIVIVDTEGAPLIALRMTEASPRSYDFALGKARTSAATGLSTEDYAYRVSIGQMSALPDAVAIQGGIPIMIDGELAGAVGASGLPPQLDAIIADAVVAAISSLR